MWTVNEFYALMGRIAATIITILTLALLATVESVFSYALIAAAFWAGWFVLGNRGNRKRLSRFWNRFGLFAPLLLLASAALLFYFILGWEIIALVFSALAFIHLIGISVFFWAMKDMRM
ncbi:MAG: hypothetical protein J4F41_00035 [Alphaproteobacteria bacterium]|nr:hypothetical protein [Alphaproteobacteria bacterium]